MSHATAPAQLETDDVIQSRKFDPEKAFYLDWGRESLKQVVPSLNQSLQRIATLVAGLLGGLLALVKSLPLPGWSLAVTAVLFLLSLGFALYGSLPHGRAVRVGQPVDVAMFKDEVAALKEWYLWASAIALAAGFAVAVVGLLWQWLIG